MANGKRRQPATRFTVSLPMGLMGTLHRLQSERRYANRSEFVRDLLRAELVKKEWEEQDGETVGVLVLVYDHHTRALADKLTKIQHASHDMIAAALHVHLDPHTCLEAIPLRGTAGEIRTVANRLLATKGVRYGQLVPATGRRLR
ncbi:MAG TPA: nickel-responsive transcriptional regulator NikR [Methylomirabilota bacterium]|nr:nickel-responsive transcriptional regulator NikR [Methylomirabilota bacterium]